MRIIPNSTNTSCSTKILHFTPAPSTGVFGVGVQPLVVYVFLFFPKDQTSYMSAEVTYDYLWQCNFWAQLAENAQVHIRLSFIFSVIRMPEVPPKQPQRLLSARWHVNDTWGRPWNWQTTFAGKSVTSAWFESYLTISVQINSLTS